MNGRPITLVSLTPKQIYEEKLKLKKGKMAEKENLFIRETFFANKVLLGFDDDVIFLLGTNLLILKDVFHDTDLSLNLFKEMEDDTNQVMSEFGLKMFIDKFCKIRHISQTVHQIKLNFFREIQDT
jgi:hypothetical protein